MKEPAQNPKTNAKTNALVKAMLLVALGLTRSSFPRSQFPTISSTTPIFGTNPLFVVVLRFRFCAAAAGVCVLHGC